MSRWDESNRSSSPFGAWLPACPVIDNRVVHTAIHRFKRPDRRGKKTACQVIAWGVQPAQDTEKAHLWDSFIPLPDCWRPFSGSLGSSSIAHSSHVHRREGAGHGAVHQRGTRRG